jgi:uncharacterized membrane protein YbaN (DUF454 family)
VSCLKHPIRITLAVICLIIGIIGGFVPILQGWIFILLALILFFPSHPKVGQVMNKVEPRWPRFARLLRSLGVGEPIAPEPPRYNPDDPR